MANPWTPALGLLVVLLGATAAAGPPPEGRCPTLGGSGATGEDVTAPALKEGAVLGFEDLPALESLLPEAVWTYRDAFFYEGMRLEVGPCHRRYPVPSFVTATTEAFRGRARLDESGNLHGHVAGVPFPPEGIDPGDPLAALRWAWSFAYRYRGAGPVGSFRIADISSRKSSPHNYKGTFFFVQTGSRADLSASEYQAPETSDVWVAGGEFEEPFDARHLAWRQARSRKADERYKEPDDIFVYVPTMRKPRRSATPWVDGVFTPRYTVSGDGGGGPVPFGRGGEQYGSLDSINPTAGISIAASEDIRRGFTGLALRPNAYDWAYLGEREVLAPLNGMARGYPDDPDRNFGPYGLSVASDRWDVRQAVVIEGTARRSEGEVARVQLWIDWQTQQPLYYVSRRKDGFLLDVGILVHRFSGDQPDYPLFPNEEKANVFDPVAAAFYFVPGGGGWRRESYDVRSLPLEPKQLRRYTTTDDLLKGH
jgi:hypothetical protein